MTELLRPFAWLEPVVDLFRLGVFLAFVALGLMAARARRETAEAGRRRVDRLILYVLILSAAVGLGQVESWPFSTWALVHGLSSKTGAALELEGLDASGQGYPVDFRVLEPLAPEEFASWLRANLARLGPAGRQSLGRFLLGRAEEARVRFRGGGRVGRNEWLLGPFAAPHHFHVNRGKTWASPSAVPATPFTGLRVWLLEWDVEERRADPSRVARRLLLEFRESS